MSPRADCTKVAAYITQDDRLLVFRHVDYPEAGIQVPGGTVNPGEAWPAAALREAREETGLTELVVVGYLGARFHTLRVIEMDRHQLRHYYHLHCNQPTPASWQTLEMDPSDGTKTPIAFEMYWVPLSAVPRLSGWMGELLSEIGGSETG